MGMGAVQHRSSVSASRLAAWGSDLKATENYESVSSVALLGTLKWWDSNCGSLVSDATTLPTSHNLFPL